MKTAQLQLACTTDFVYDLSKEIWYEQTYFTEHVDQWKNSFDTFLPLVLSDPDVFLVNIPNNFYNRRAYLISNPQFHNSNVETFSCHFLEVNHKLEEKHFWVSQGYVGENAFYLY